LGLLATLHQAMNRVADLSKLASEVKNKHAGMME
jgi:hypothetical protein